MNLEKTKILIDKAIQDFDLNLEKAVVLTEAASGPFIVTPLIAALAGARVKAVTRDSQYAKASDVIKTTKKLAEKWHVSDQIEFGLNPLQRFISEADVITNLGFVRPIDEKMVRFMKPTAVVPLMFEPWEHRQEDIDLQACQQKGIMVMGTDEEDQRLKMFDYVGLLVARLLNDEGYSLKDKKIALIGSGIFVEKTESILKQKGVVVERIDVLPETKKNILLSSDIDIIVVLEHHKKIMLIGEQGLIQNDHSFWKGCHILHICGQIDAEWVINKGANITPNNPAPFGYMSVTTAYLGEDPVIRLHAAGLKVGEAMWRNRLKGFSGKEYIELVKKQSPALSFD